MAKFNLQIISPDRVEFEGDVVSVVAPGEMGYFGVLAHHEALLSTLTEGKLTVSGGEAGNQNYMISGGFLEVHDNKVVVLAREMETLPV